VHSPRIHNMGHISSRTKMTTIPRAKGGPVTLTEMKGANPKADAFITGFFLVNKYEGAKKFYDNYPEVQAVFTKYDMTFPSDDFEVNSWITNDINDDFANELVNTIENLLSNCT